MSPDLIAFLKAWYEWATNGAPGGLPFFRSHGLCVGMAGPVSDEFLAYRKAHMAEVDYHHPFGGRDEYYERAFYRTQHECPKRLAWVRERLIEAGELADA